MQRHKGHSPSREPRAVNTCECAPGEGSPFVKASRAKEGGWKRERGRGQKELDQGKERRDEEEATEGGEERSNTATLSCMWELVLVLSFRNVFPSETLTEILTFCSPE